MVIFKSCAFYLFIYLFLSTGTNDFIWTSSFEIKDQKRSITNAEMKHVNSSEILDSSVSNTKFFELFLMF